MPAPVLWGCAGKSGFGPNGAVAAVAPPRMVKLLMRQDTRILVP